MTHHQKQPPTLPHGSRAQVVCGILMGTVDAVPGVSGGTVALVLGIYDQLVTSISRFDRTWLGLLRTRSWRLASERVQLAFLTRLAIGIAVGLVATLSAVNYLLENIHTRPFTLAVFFGMIMASTVLVARMICWPPNRSRLSCLVLVLVGASVSFWLTTLQDTHHDTPSLLYLFGCGSIAICAMILPGISGAMVLWIVGIYEHLSQIPRAILRGQGSPEMLLEFVVFAVGCLVGLLAFSRLLRHLLTNYRPVTIAVLCGIMIGALNKLWPFQVVSTSKGHLQTSNTLPAGFELQSAGIILTVVVSALVILWIDRSCQSSLSVVNEDCE